MNVSILILTHNEETNLPTCLSSLSWCNDIVVLDSGSTDGTVGIARAFGTRLLVRPFDDFASQRNFGLEHGLFRHEWVLHLDADEVVTDQFVSALELLQPARNIFAYQVPSKTILFGRWLRYAGMWPLYQVRLGHKNHLRFKQIGHGQREDLPSEQIGVFSESYLHYSFSHGMLHWLHKHARYAAAEAKFNQTRKDNIPHPQRPPKGLAPVSRRRHLKALASGLPPFLRPMARFIHVYFLCQGFRDGRAGLAYATMLSVYEGMTAVFSYEAQLTQEQPAATAAMPASASRLTAEASQKG